MTRTVVRNLNIVMQAFDSAEKADLFRSTLGGPQDYIILGIPKRTDGHILHRAKNKYAEPEKFIYVVINPRQVLP